MTLCLLGTVGIPNFPSFPQTVTTCAHGTATSGFRFVTLRSAACLAYVYHVACPRNWACCANREHRPAIHQRPGRTKPVTPVLPFDHQHPANTVARFRSRPVPRDWQGPISHHSLPAAFSVSTALLPSRFPGKVYVSVRLAETFCGGYIPGPWPTVADFFRCNRRFPLGSVRGLTADVHLQPLQSENLNLPNAFFPEIAQFSGRSSHPSTLARSNSRLRFNVF